MKYFTPELWNGFNSEMEEEYQRARTEWEKNSKEYCIIFEKIKNRLPKHFLKVFMKEHGFHDYELKKYEIIHGARGKKSPILVNLIVDNGEFCWQISYKEVTKIQINYEEQVENISQNRKYYRGFDDYGYNEILEVTDTTLSHEVLFASDATILVHFQKVSIRKVVE